MNTKRILYKTAIWTKTNQPVALLGFFESGSDVTWMIRTIEGKTYLVHECQLVHFVL